MLTEPPLAAQRRVAYPGAAPTVESEPVSNIHRLSELVNPAPCQNVRTVLLACNPDRRLILTQRRVSHQKPLLREGFRSRYNQLNQDEKPKESFMINGASCRAGSRMHVLGEPIERHFAAGAL
jgi:hypothetical protein